MDEAERNARLHELDEHARRLYPRSSADDPHVLDEYFDALAERHALLGLDVVPPEARARSLDTLLELKRLMSEVGVFD